MPTEAARLTRAELREEAGLEAGHLEEIGQFNPFNGVTDELCRVSVATGLHAVEAAPDATEEFELLLWSEDQVCRAVADGDIWDGMTLAAWSLYRSLKRRTHAGTSPAEGDE